MGSVELERIRMSLDNARSPEEVFGPFTNATQAEKLEAAKKVFRQIAKAVHPDIYQGTPDFEHANTTFKKLARLWEQAQTRINNGTYGTQKKGDPFKPFVIRTQKCQYNVESFQFDGDVCALYKGVSDLTDIHTTCLLKFPIQPADNDLALNETRILKHLKRGRGYEKLRHFVSQLMDTFTYKEQPSGIVRQVNVLPYWEGWYSLQEVHEAYPRGIDAKDVAWMWRRILVALGFAHANNVIHGAVLPIHILISPQQHGVILIDWSYAVLDPPATGEYISAISNDYRAWYPAEVFAREMPTPGLDISMAAKCMIYLLNGNPYKNALPETVPWQIQNYLKACTLPKPQQRPQDTSILLDEFDALIERLWGPRTFHAFSMPKC
jgi:serine/threonine protein kinase